MYLYIKFDINLKFTNICNLYYIVLSCSRAALMKISYPILPSFRSLKYINHRAPTTQTTPRLT